MTFSFTVPKKGVLMRGFSLVELMVSLTIFSIVMTVSVGTLLVLIDANAKAQALSSSMTNLNFALDSMTRNLRMGRNFYCASGSALTGALPSDSSTQNCTTGNTAIVFTPGTASSTRVAYRLLSNRIEQRIDRGSTQGSWVPITSDQPPIEVTISTMRFIVDGVANTDASDISQPRLSFLIAGSVQNGLASTTQFSIQSRITQRVLDY